MAKIISFPKPKENPWKPRNPMDLYFLQCLKEKGVVEDGEGGRIPGKGKTED